ncbi:MAG: glycosyltransferase family 39 protein [Anaerolineales bacterium]|nr:glycosyltransferase family 39 protein [Anaerolineales bacterium]
MSTITLPSQLHPSTLAKRILPGVTIGALIVAIIMIASFALHIYNIESIGYANEYYTAAVEAMLKSWSNFFFVAAEPGGSVTVDKPPLGLWIQAVFAYFLGVSGFSVTLPNILAGVFGIGLLYHMVKKYMGELAGITAAFVMAITPVFIATNRNNTMDGMLVFTLLLAAWAFIKATESGKARCLLARRVHRRAGLQHQNAASLFAPARILRTVFLRLEGRLVQKDSQPRHRHRFVDCRFTLLGSRS